MVKLRTVLLLLAAVGLTACNPSAQSTDVDGSQEASDETVASEESAEEAESETAAPELTGLSRADIESELASGVSCSLENDGRALLVVVGNDAIARPYGTMRHFTFGGDEEPGAFWDGGVFTAGTIAIRIQPAAGEGEQIEGVNVRPATVSVTEEGQSGTLELDATWECGA